MKGGRRFRVFALASRGVCTDRDEVNSWNGSFSLDVLLVEHEIPATKDAHLHYRNVRLLIKTIHVIAKLSSGATGLGMIFFCRYLSSNNINTLLEENYIFEHFSK